MTQRFIPILGVFPDEAVFVNVSDVKNVRVVKGKAILTLLNGELYEVSDETAVARILKVVGGLAGLSSQEILKQQREAVDKK